MAASAARSRFTPREYLALERLATRRSEFYDGQIFAMPGASRAHNLITLNIASELNRQLKDRPCEAYSNDMRVRLREGGPYVYPDVVVACGEFRFEDAQSDTLLNPLAVIEVLSPSTEAFDRGGKFAYYRASDSLQDYVLVGQDRISVERFSRRGADWLLTPVYDLDGTLTLDSLNVRIPIAEIYAKVAFPTDEPQAGPR